jgi:hypothetical protein
VLFQIVPLLTQIESQPVTISLFGSIQLDKSALAIFVSSIAIWLFTLLQFELDLPN